MLIEVGGAGFKGPSHFIQAANSGIGVVCHGQIAVLGGGNG